MPKKKIKLLDDRNYFKPFQYEWAFEAYKASESMHWMAKEIPMIDDVKDWKNKLSQEEKEFLTHIFRFFTQSDIDVAGGYIADYLPRFKHPEIRMMLCSFAARECFDDQTEALTNSGWKLFKDLDPEDLVGQFDTNSKRISFAKPLDYITKDFKGLMKSFQSEDINLVVTPNHRMLVNQQGEYSFVKAKDLTGGSCVKAGKGCDTPAMEGESRMLTLEEELEVALLAQGVLVTKPLYGRNIFDKSNNYIVTFADKTKALRFCRILYDLDVAFTMHSYEGATVSFTGFSLAKVFEERASLFGNQACYSNFSPIKLNAILYNYNQWAGEKTNSLSMPSSIISMLRALAGVAEASRLCAYPEAQDVPYDGKVYCVTMPLGTVVVRRQGHTSVQGNCVHIEAYSHLIETLGMPESTYNEFLNYDAMKDKHEFFKQFAESEEMLPLKIALISAFTEGVALFSSFIMLLNFPRFGKMKGMGQIISWSIADEAVIKGTEVLTKEGWKKIEDVRLDEEVYEYCMETKQASFQPIQKIKRVVRDESYVFESDSAYQHVSPNHRMIILNDDGSVGERKAKDCTGEETLILNGNKAGEFALSDCDADQLALVLVGKTSPQWVYQKLPEVSSLWAAEAVEEYLEFTASTEVSEEITVAFEALASIAGGIIREGQFIPKSTSKITKTKLTHDPKDFYCLAVPGKAFFIRDQGKISVTGNTLHCESMIKLFREYVKENKHLWNDELKSEIYKVATKMVELEDNFIDLAFGKFTMEGLDKEDVKQYVRYIADRRLISMGMKSIFHVRKNPLTWVDGMLGVTHSNFFEQKVTDYAKASLTGSWEEIWAQE